ncbi:MAG: hypothetical protein ACP5Q4_01485 [Candidatus Caldatribacteriaceae bacterium]
MRKIGFFLFFLFLSVSVASAWASSVEDIIGKSPYTEEEKAYLQSPVDEMVREVEAQKLPSAFLLSKLKEGIGKRVQPYTLVQALERRKSALLEAKAILDEAGVEGKTQEKTLTNLAIAVELSVPASLLREMVRQMKQSDPRDLPKVVESISTLLEVGVSPERIGSVTEKIVARKLASQEIGKIAALLERSRRNGVDVERTAGVLEEALKKYDNFNLVEMEVRQFIASSRQKPSLSSGQGITASSPGISGTTPVQEGGTPLESSSSGHPPSQEGGGPLE